MQFKEETVPLSAINTKDGHYRITTTTSVEDLMASIEGVGLLHPPLLSRQSTGFRIVTGFRRINACRKLGRSDIVAKVLRPEASDVACVKLAVTDNSLQRSLNLIEISRSVGLIRTVIKDDAVLLKTSTQLGLPNNLSFLKKAETLLHLPGPVQDGVLSGSISLAMALDLGKLENDAGCILAEIFDTLRLSLNKQREMLTLTQEIAARENLSVSELLQENSITDLLGTDKLDRTRKVRKLRYYLKARRFPKLTEAENNFQEVVKKLKLGPGVQFIAPKYFEGSTYTIHLSFDNFTELEDRRKTLEKIMKTPEFKAILIE